MRPAFRTAEARPPRPTHRHAARRAQASLASGVFAFAMFTLGLAVAAETVEPQWRDPEYGHRLNQVRRWQRERPTRPVVLVLGSSRTQYGVAPEVMAFPDRPGVPVVYNFGYRAAHPMGVHLQISRILDAGVKPRAVLLQIANSEIRHGRPAEVEFLDKPDWGTRLSATDLRLFAPFTADSRPFESRLLVNRRNPWGSYRESVISDLLPEWQSPALRPPHESWERMDRYGYSPLRVERVRTAEFVRAATADLKNHGAVLSQPVGARSDQALRGILDRLRAEGVPVALFRAPESPAYQKLYDPTARHTSDTYVARLVTDYGVPVFAAPEHLAEDDFADGYHLLPGGAAKYSRWLADEHLRPWLAQVLK